MFLVGAYNGEVSVISSGSTKFPVNVTNSLRKQLALFTQILHPILKFMIPHFQRRHHGISPMVLALRLIQITIQVRDRPSKRLALINQIINPGFKMLVRLVLLLDLCVLPVKFSGLTRKLSSHILHGVGLLLVD